MKKQSIILIGLLAMILSSCLVKSLHQFYSEKDVIFDNKLIGSWLDDDSTKWVISQYSIAKGSQYPFSKGSKQEDSLDNSYLVEMYEEDALLPSKFNVHLFELGEKLYLDFLPIREDQNNEMLDIHLISSHSIARMKFQDNGQIGISWFNEGWLEELFEENKIKISHEVIGDQHEKQYVLTASTEELQKFLKKYDNEPEEILFSNDDNFLYITLAKIK